MRRLALCIFAASLLGAYGAFFTGNIVSGDNIIQDYQTVQIADRHRVSFSVDQVATILHSYDWGLNTRFGVNRDRTTYTQVHGVGQSLLTLPLFVGMRSVKHALHLAIPADMTLWCMNWPVFAVLCVMATLGMCSLAGAPGVVWPTLITFAAAFSSPIWMFSTIPHNVVGEMLVIAAAIDLCLLLDVDHLGADGTRDSIAAAALAVLLVFGVVVRPFFASAIPAFAGWFLYSILNSPLSSEKKRRTLTVFAVVFFLGGTGLAAFNTYYLGSLWTSPYHDLGNIMNFDGSWTVGFSGTFLSPLKSPLYFFPLVVLLPVTLSVLVWRREPVAWFIILFLLPQMYFIPRYSMWDGGPDLFARHWLRLVPIVFLSLAAVVARIDARTWTNTGLLAATLSLAALGLRAQLLTVMTNEREVYARAVTAIEARNPGRGEFLYHESIPNLLAGRTLVSTIQREELDTPRSFLAARSVVTPSQRLSAAAAALMVGALSLSAFWKWRRA